ncbi:MAG: peptidoglycan-binding protein [Actinomycetota bacterium]|nr:peptidoglycan-binding protein [Actinomycetota bacterium]
MRRRTWLLVGAAVVAAGTTGAVIATSGTDHAAGASPAPPPNTATVTQGSLASTVSVAGILTFAARPDGTPYTVVNQASGTYTVLPTAGQAISQGQVLYRVDDSPVVLLYGKTPAYRSLSSGAVGADVAELNADLVALGYASSAQLSPTSPSFGSATTTAVQKLQAALGETQTGTLTLGEAVFEPAALRVTAVSAPLGGSAQPGQSVMAGTSTTRQVQVALDASQQTDVAVGDQVTITLPDNRTTPGVVTSVGTVATCSAGSGSGPGPSSAAPGTDNCSSATPGSNSTPTVSVAVTPSDPAVTGTWDQAPVQVGITTARVPNALAVPVTALLAQAGGGYSVEVVGAAGADHLVAVTLGLFDDAAGLVQVTGAGLAAGQKVVVPAT